MRAIIKRNIGAVPQERASALIAGQRCNVRKGAGGKQNRMSGTPLVARNRGVVSPDQSCEPTRFIGRDARHVTQKDERSVATFGGRNARFERTGQFGADDAHDLYRGILIPHAGFAIGTGNDDNPRYGRGAGGTDRVEEQGLSVKQC